MFYVVMFMFGISVVGVVGLARPRPSFLLTLLALEVVVCGVFGMLISFCVVTGDATCAFLGVVLLGAAAVETAVGLAVYLSTSGA